MLHWKLRLFVARVTTSMRNKFLLLQKVETAFTFCNMKIVPRRGGKMGNKQTIETFR